MRHLINFESEQESFLHFHLLLNVPGYFRLYCKRAEEERRRLNRSFGEWLGMY